VSEPDDLTLLAAWRAGNAKAGQTLFRRHFDAVYGFFENKVSSGAEDLTQATFLACVRARDQFRGDSSFRTYLFTIARHELYRMLSERKRDHEKLDFEASSIAQLVTTPGTKLARDEDHRRLIETLQQLPVEQQVLLELHYWQGLDIPQLAEVFDAQDGTIRVRLHRARKALEDRLQRATPVDDWMRSFSRSVAS
jgi:RNA polymerase sigma-70 factor (ECF subfamily)